jgi:tetratricopeptide (TPR) repeat protein
MSEFTNQQKLHHYMGIEMNIQTWNLLSKGDRTEQDDVRMINFAHASLYHWKFSSKFEPINAQRGEWLISRVYAALGKGDKALSHANETMRFTIENEFKDFDLAYAYEAIARAYAALGNEDRFSEFYTKAKDAGKLINGSEDQKYFNDDLASKPWFGYRI